MLDIDGAVEAAWPDEGVAAHYGDPLREQRLLAAGRALTDRSNRGVVTVSGPDRLSWLHSLTSQHLENITTGQTAQALILSPHGHVEHHLTLTDDGTRTWIHVEPGTAPALAGYLDSMRFMLRVEVEDVTGRYGVVSLAGPAGGIGDVARSLAGVAMDASFGVDVVMERGLMEGAVRASGLAAAGMWAFEAARIAAHVPRLGLDSDHKTLAHEIGLVETAVHLNKGCYRGQETVARIQNVGHPPRRLVLLHLDGSADRLPAHGSPVTLPDGTETGFTGSAALHYELGPIGLALIKRTVPVDATLLADGVAAAQEVIVAPDAGGTVKVTLRRDSVPQPPAGARRLK